MSEGTSVYKGQCHCGKVQFEVETDLSSAVRCNCSVCKRKGAVMHRIDPAQFKLLAGEEDLTLYQFHTNLAKHYFCKHCGIYPFHRPRRAPEMYVVNVGCLEGVDPLSLETGLVDGKSFD